MPREEENVIDICASVDAESFPSRKREREISQEPSTPATDIVTAGAGEESSGSADHDVLFSPRLKGRFRKKNRTQGLDDTKEEELDQELEDEESGRIEDDDDDDDDNKMVMSVGGSPPHETKMRQISEGVGGIKMIRKPGAATVDEMPLPDSVADDHVDGGVSTDPAEEHGEKLGQVAPSSDVDAKDPATSSIPEEATQPETSTNEALRPPSPPIDPLPSTSGHSDHDPASKRDSESDDIEQEKILKRKLADRAVSESREAEDGGKKASRKAVEDVATMPSFGAKRCRDKADKGEDTKETKRPSPPPEEKGVSSTSKDQVPGPSAISPLPSGFMAYVGSSSPFAFVKGPKWFSGSSSSESAKRPRDDADTDDNPRETKRPSPPPEQRKDESQESEASGSSNGSAVFASPTSPFAKYQNGSVLGASSKSSGVSKAWSSGVTSSHEQTTSRSGFDAFASVSSPFGRAARSKSPVGAHGRRSPSPWKTTPSTAKNSSAFSAYAAGAQGFALASTSTSAAGKRARAEDGLSDSKRKRNSSESNGLRSDEEGGEETDERDKMSFGDRLRAEKDDQGSGGSDDDGKLVLTEQELHTGEEEEETIYQVRGKLFALGEQSQWREKGTGIIKLNLRKSDGGGARLVMRKDAVYTVILNATLFKGMRCSYAPQDQRYLRFSTFEDGCATHYNLRLANAKIASGLLEEVNAHIPS